MEIMRELKKQQHETLVQYADRLIDGKKSGLYDIDYVELYELLFGKSVSSVESRKRTYGILDFLEGLKKEGIEGIKSNLIINDIEDKKIELSKERMKLQFEKAEYNKFMREQARAELFEEKVINALKEKVRILEVPERILEKRAGKSSILLISDLHYGKEFEIKGLGGDVLNAYSIEIFEKRMWRLLYKTLDILKKENMNHVNVINLGDSIEGILRANSQLMSLKFGVVDSFMEFINFMVIWLNELSKHVRVDYYNISGNHDDLRIVTGKKGDFPHENIARMADWVLESMLRDNENIKIHKENVCGLVHTEIQGFNILAIHGDNEKKLENSIKDYSMIYGEEIDMLLTGHKHFDMTSNVYKNKDIIQCPSLVGMCEYSLKLKKSANAGAKLIFIEDGLGKTIDYSIKLD